MTLGGVIVTAGALGYLLGTRRSQRSQSTAQGSVQSSKVTRLEPRPAWGVRFVADISGPCCQQARDISGNEYQASVAPVVPLKTCDTLECRCKLEQLTERRNRRPRRIRGDRRQATRFDLDHDDRRYDVDRRRGART